MRVIGITGGVGAGKSTVLTMLKQLCKCDIIMSDDVAKSMMNKGGELEPWAIKIFGDKAYNESGDFDRAYVASVIYGDDYIKEKWNGIVHPMVNKKIACCIDDNRKSGRYDFTFIEAALLIENHYDKICDELWYVYADENTRIERLKKQRGYTPQKTKSIISAQQSDSQFRKYCNFVIDTGNGMDATRQILQNKLEEYALI